MIFGFNFIAFLFLIIVPLWPEIFVLELLRLGSDSRQACLAVTRQANLQSASKAVTTAELVDKASFVNGCMQMRVMDQYNGKWHSLDYVSKQQITVIQLL